MANSDVSGLVRRAVEARLMLISRGLRGRLWLLVLLLLWWLHFLFLLEVHGGEFPECLGVEEGIQLGATSRGEEDMRLLIQMRMSY